jgi:hypothetical protein
MNTMALPTVLYGIAQVLNLYNKVGNAKVRIYNTLALPTLLCGCETWSVGEQDKTRITPIEMKFGSRTTKYIWQEYRPVKIFDLNVKLTQLQRKFKMTEINGYNMFGERTVRQPHLVVKYQPCGK